MPKKTPQSENNPAHQHEEFVRVARELGTDDSEETFDRMLGKLSKAPPPETVQQRKAAIERRKKLVEDNRDAGKSAPPPEGLRKRNTDIERRAGKRRKR